MPDTRTTEELSAEVARRLFGKRICQPDYEFCGKPGMPPRCSVPCSAITPPYASDHNAALGLVVPEMRKRGWKFDLQETPNGVQAVFYRLSGTHREGLLNCAKVPFGEEPRAICEAALAAPDAEQTKGASHPATCSYWNEPYSVCDCGLLLAALDAEGGE